MTLPPGFDRRLTPARPDLAAAHLRGVIDAERYAEGVRRRIARPVADLRGSPRLDAPLDSQAILGEIAVVYEDVEGWAFCQLEADGYVGYLSSDALDEDAGPPPTHRVKALRSLRFPGPDLKLPVIEQIPEGATVAVVEIIERRGTPYALLADRTALPLVHLEPIETPRRADFVAAARRYCGAPYVWGGRSAFGLDCSGLVQTALAAAGIKAPRDTDMQEKALGEAQPGGAPLADCLAGDLVFWRGHVGIVSGPNRLLHANAFHMAVVEEPLDGAIARIAAAGSAVTSIRRLPIGAS